MVVLKVAKFLRRNDKKKEGEKIIIMVRQAQTIEVITDFSYTLYTVLANRFNVC